MKSYFLKSLLLSTVLVLGGCGEDKKPVASQEQTAASMKQDNFEQVTTRLDGPAVGAVDGINGVVSPKAGSVIPISGEKIEIGGIYVDAVRGEAAAGVIILIDDKPYVATYGGERPDIVSANNNPKYLKSQFYAGIPTSKVGKGIHDVRIRVIASDKSGYFESSWVAKIDVK